ncbi:ATP-binding cassette domain-containing protein [Cryobacterium melibiosiphilum]|uniref:ATP-binding cassette domain-containing protein n=1 Tax=Cryobacterium melibiosiphilum TaxID=995039 RepID=A0A3A5MJ45_9MICO|nr:ATP-binding cassette domain-containing protein [Cryobacterium melibiosiphilum]RJT84634.1 ATP-binding cassette domain-containing protein [Cryobacterium melibiosiphilum]
MTVDSSKARRAASGSAAGASIDARGWGWRHAGRRAWAVSNLDLRIEPGERVLLLGASGSGKSTFVHALAGVLGGDDEGEHSGQLLLNGSDPMHARGRVGLLLQDPDSQVILARVGDDVAFGCENLGVPRDEIWRRVEAALRMVGLNLPLNHPTSALSGGQKQRLALAGVLAMRPGLLLLDEPTANLDPAGVQEVRDSVARVLDQSDATFLVIEHRVSIWQDLVNRVIVLDRDGGVLADGAPGDVLARQREHLAESGVWVPGVAHQLPARARATAPGASPSSPEPLLQARSLSIARSANQVVASGIDVQIVAGRALAITGPNGAGKSTLALTLAGLLTPTAGRVVASREFARGAAGDPIRWKSRDLLTRIGTVFQDPEHQLIAATVRAELAVGPRALGLTDAVITSRIDELLQRLRLDHLAEANPFTLSGGEKRRLSVGTVLATQPGLLVLDEPTFGQDFRTWREIVRFLGELIDGGTAVVAVSHDADFVAALADVEYRLPETERSAAPVVRR